jgi:predicted transcriptional regulator
MEVLWTRGECKVREVMRTLDRDLAYTTVMTTLDRLFRKKLLGRRKSGRAYIYSPRITCQEWKDKVARDVVVAVSESDTKKTILRVATTIRLDNLRRPNVILALL